MAIIEPIFVTRSEVVRGLHSGVLALIAISIAVLQLKQENPFKIHFKTMVSFLIAVCIYIMAGLASIGFNGFIEEMTTNVSLLSGLLASLLLYLIMVPALGWVSLALWVLLVVTIAYKMISSWHLQQQPQQDNQSQDHVTIQVSPDGPQRGQLTMVKEKIDKRQNGSPIARWISVYSPREEMKQKYHYNVTDWTVSRKIKKGKKGGLLVSSVASCSSLWALVLDEGTGFSDQVHKLASCFLPVAWIKEQWEKGFYITAIGGADNESSLVVMSKGTQFFDQQEYKVSNSFPFKWIRKKRKKGYYVTAMATAGSRWAIVMSKTAGFSNQVVKLDSQYPSNPVLNRWDGGYNITAIAATVNQSAFVLSVLRKKPENDEQETVGSSDFPSKFIMEKREKNFYVTSLCYGLKVP